MDHNIWTISYGTFMLHFRIGDGTHLKPYVKMMSTRSVSFAEWREKIHKRCCALDRKLIVRDQQNIIPFEIHFPKESF